MRIRVWLVCVLFSSFLASCARQAAMVDFDIRPVAPSQVTGSGKASQQVNAAGGLVLVLEVSVRGPANEISRAGTDPLQPNLLWHIVEGDCAAWREPDVGNLNKVLYKWSPPPTHPDAMDFRTVISRSDLGDLSRPHALTAFRDGGGGPFYACGDLPLLGR